jgi:hypothetical protein
MKCAASPNAVTNCTGADLGRGDLGGEPNPGVAALAAAAPAHWCGALQEGGLDFRLVFPEQAADEKGYGLERLRGHGFVALGAQHRDVAGL